jgi:transcriptional regulator with GAF, ATPase, and Fis domain
VTGAPKLLATVVKDITERKLAEQELRRREAELAAIQKEQLSRENISLKEQVEQLQEGVPVAGWLKEIVGTSPAIRRTMEQVEKVTASESTVLITGETGTGKELIARAIHFASPRRSGKRFLPINLAEIPRDLIGSTLFGSEKGAFTSSDVLRLGIFEIAKGGTVFLDEIAELPWEQQPSLLRVLQEKAFYRIGGAGVPITADVRVIVATNRKLRLAVEDGNFREDLFYRLNVLEIEVPSLRERKEDIEALVRHFTEEFGRKNGKAFDRIDRRSMLQLQDYDWPGNVRELQNIIERAVVLGTGKILTVEEDWLKPVRKFQTDAPGPQATMPLSTGEYERQRIEDALRRSRGVVAAAAEMLGLPASTLHSKLRKLGINAHRFKVN